MLKRLLVIQGCLCLMSHLHSNHEWKGRVNITVSQLHSFVADAAVSTPTSRKASRFIEETRHEANRKDTTKEEVLNERQSQNQKFKIKFDHAEKDESAHQGNRQEPAKENILDHERGYESGKVIIKSTSRAGTNETPHQNNRQDTAQIEVVREKGSQNQNIKSIPEEISFITTSFSKRHGSSRRPRSVLPQASPVCSGDLSCKNKCLQPRHVVNDQKLSCFCDVDCEFFQDCCADFDNFCKSDDGNNTAANSTNSYLGNNGLDLGLTNGSTTAMNTTLSYQTPNTTSLLSNSNRTLNTKLWKCFTHSNVLERTNGVWMIGSCPDYWPKDDVFHQCRNLSGTNRITKDNYRYLPVYTSNGRVYHNRFCAQCNGVPSNETKSYQLSSYCRYQLSQNLTHSGKMSCSDIGWRPGQKHPRRYCLKLRSKCVNAAMRQRCLNGKVRIVNDNFCLYKNIYCAECDGKLSRYVMCGPHASQLFLKCGSSMAPRFIYFAMAVPKRLSHIFQIKARRPLSQINIKLCDNGKVFDHYSKTCREILRKLPQMSNIIPYKVTFWLQPLSDCSNCINAIDLDKNIALGLGVSPKQVTDSYLVGASKLKLRFHLQIKESETLYAAFILQKIFNFTSPFNITIDKQTFTVMKAVTQTRCITAQIYHRNEYTVLTNNDQTAVVIIKTGEVLRSKDYYTNGTSANHSRAIFVCRHHHISNCSGQWVLMNEGEFNVLENGSIFVNASRRLYDRSEYIWKNSSVFVCENFTRIYFVKAPLTKDDGVLSILTLVCMVISIIALVFVLVTYSLFPELRTPPGINLMNLSIAILLAQLLWILGSGQTDKPLACTVIAVLLHYLFLVSFVWTSIIAFDTWRAFTAKGRRSLADSKFKRLMHRLRYMAVGWLSVMVYVAICVTLDLTNTFSLGYQSSKACWMKNPWATLFFFAVPVALILMLNIVLYIQTMRAIYVTTKTARVATDDKDRKQTFGIYVRIASVMGFTWILGFVAPFGWNFLWYIFTILNGSQGLYIAMAFALNKRVINLYKKHLFGHSKSACQTRSTNTQVDGIDNESMDTRL